MNKKIFLTSAIAMGVVAPAMAEPERIDTFPNAANDEFMLANKVYTNAATAANMDSVYEGTVNAVAEYDVIDYILTAGKYLPKDSETITTCPAGSYCAGGETFQYSATADQGIESCPTGYGSSAAGASSANECYRTCTISDVEHSTGVSGGYYYGNNNQCGATGCVNGWHLKSKTGVDIYNGIKSIESMCMFTCWLTDEANATWSNSGYNEEWSVAIKQTSAYDWPFSEIKGISKCSTTGTASEKGTLVDDISDDYGENCYYKIIEIDGFSVSSKWVKMTDSTGYNSTCREVCRGGYNFLNSDNVKKDLNSIGSVGLALCEANTITINWSDVNAADVTANNAGTATYGSDVRTPVKANTYKGKTFKGWKFSKPEQTTTGGSN